ncbi:MAG: MarR family transcriptional regulator [Armatimonadia bacterium]
MSVHDDRTGEIGELMRDIFGRFLRPPTPPSSEMNITMGQIHCLGTIAHLGKPTMSQVAEELGLHPSTVTVLVDGLVSHGLVRRAADPKDRRVVRVSETAKGRKNHEMHMAHLRGQVEDMLSGLNDDELAKVHESLGILREAAKQYAEKLKQTAKAK